MKNIHQANTNHRKADIRQRKGSKLKTSRQKRIKMILEVLVTLL